MAMVGIIFLGTFVYQAGAVSMGPYVDISSGSGTFEWDISGYEFDVDTNSVAVGFALDTAVTNQSFFNYRLNIGFEGQEHEDEENLTLELDGVSFENIFGFALVPGPYFRWWVGPLVRFGFSSGETDTHFMPDGTPYKNEFEFVQIGFGVATGINFKVGYNVTLASSIGTRFNVACGTGETTYLGSNIKAEEDLCGEHTDLFLNFALLF
ncbi:hypothetical protein VU13_02240 [Desulfobulbus sp. US5]|nr:hypothetical protein [Desulfobulbus sp. US5]